MNKVNGATAQKRGFLKSIVLALLVCFLTVVVGCSDSPKKATTDIGGSRGQELRKESIQSALPLADIGGGKSIKGEFSTVTDIGGKSTNGTLQFSKSATIEEIGGKSSNIGQIVITIADIGGRKDLSGGNVYGLFVLNTEIGGKDRDIIKLSTDPMNFDIGGGGKGTTTNLLN